MASIYIRSEHCCVHSFRLDLCRVSKVQSTVTDSCRVLNSFNRDVLRPGLLGGHRSAPGYVSPHRTALLTLAICPLKLETRGESVHSIKTSRRSHFLKRNGGGLDVGAAWPCALLWTRCGGAFYRSGTGLDVRPIFLIFLGNLDVAVMAKISFPDRCPPPISRRYHVPKRTTAAISIVIYNCRLLQRARK